MFKKRIRFPSFSRIGLFNNLLYWAPLDIASAALRFVPKPLSVALSPHELELRRVTVAKGLHHLQHFAFEVVAGVFAV